MIKRPKKIERSRHCHDSALGAIEYTLVRSNARRTCSIFVDEKANVSIYVPYQTTHAYIEAFINEKISWIDKCLKVARKNQAIIADKKFDHGGEFLFLGKKYPIDVTESPSQRMRIEFNGQRWMVCLPRELPPVEREGKIKSKLIQWYRQQAEEILGGRIFHYSRLMGVSPKKIAVRSQKRMWGCCDYNRQTIHINWQIILSPIKVVDYVVVHELCHLVHPNHGKLFWRKVEKYMPDFREYKKWLKVNHAEMVLP